MLWLAIAQLRGWLHSMVGNIASPTQNVGHVCPEPTTQTGKASSAATTSHQPQLANHLASPSNEAVQPTSVEQKRGKKTLHASTIAQPKEVGTKLPTPAPQTRRRVKPAPKAKQKVAKQDMLDKQRTPVKASAQTPTAQPSGDNGI